MNDKDPLDQRLAEQRTPAPADFTERVMDALPPFRERKRSWWPKRGQWLGPALAGAAAMWALVFGIGRLQPQPPRAVGFHFELHAPGADRVELLGTFNHWKTGDIVLAGPDASGHWTATVELAEGRHEYIFLVDGERWVTDPNGATHRPDGFGRVNTVINFHEDDNA